jgi:hypothetical protein
LNLALSVPNITYASAGVFPNPAHQQLNVELYNSWPQQWSATLRNALGQTVLVHSATAKRTALDVQHLPVGVYTIDVQVDNTIIKRTKVIIQ